jgi:hypothetical protein
LPRNELERQLPPHTGLQSQKPKPKLARAALPRLRLSDSVLSLKRTLDVKRLRQKQRESERKGTWRSADSHFLFGV